MRAVALTLVALALVAVAAAAPPQWQTAAHAPGIVDVVPLHGGGIAVSTRTGLFKVGSSGLTPVAKTYTPANGGE